MNKQRMLKLAGIKESAMDWRGDDRRSQDRGTVEPAMKSFQDHMFKIKRALNNNDIDTVHRLVDGAINAFGKGFDK